MSKAEGICALIKQHQRKTTQPENKGLSQCRVKEHREVSLIAQILFDIELAITAVTAQEYSNAASTWYCYYSIRLLGLLVSLLV